MLFTHDTSYSLGFAAEWTNTAAGARLGQPELLATASELDRFVRQWTFSGRHDRTEHEAAEVRAARERVRPLWHLERDALADGVNAILTETNALPQLSRHDSYDWHIHAVALDSPMATRMLVEVAMALVDVVRADQADRLASCEATDCVALFFDASKNSSRRFCSTQCGNRMAVRLYRARH
ncbi:MAG TPA: CGNR zinc finger domain-containing protein [Candidatus Lumbricidophila sp.]|nr:CGNR zinc finger domain-containing protein [Candidatus Lumbricidophila sp.]